MNDYIKEIYDTGISFYYADCIFKPSKEDNKNEEQRAKRLLLMNAIIGLENL